MQQRIQDMVKKQVQLDHSLKDRLMKVLLNLEIKEKEMYEKISLYMKLLIS
jgi:hypothetical protein